MAEVFSSSLMIERNEMIEVTRMQKETGGLQADTTSRTGCESRTRRRDSRRCYVVGTYPYCVKRKKRRRDHQPPTWKQGKRKDEEGK